MSIIKAKIVLLKDICLGRLFIQKSFKQSKILEIGRNILNLALAEGSLRK
jgi:hypothetical protein